MNIKKSHFIFLFTLFTATLYSQKNKTDLYFECGTPVTFPYQSKIEIFAGSPNHPVYEFKTNVGLFGGLIFGYHLNSSLTLKSGAEYLLYRYTSDEKTGIVEFKGKYITTGIHVPVSINYQPFDHIPLQIGIGSYVTFVLSAKKNGTIYIDDSQMSTYTSQTSTKDIKASLKSMDFGLLGAIEYHFKTTQKWGLFTFARFNNGLINVKNDPDSYTWKTYQLLLGLGLKF